MFIASFFLPGISEAQCPTVNVWLGNPQINCDKVITPVFFSWNQDVDVVYVDLNFQVSAPLGHTFMVDDFYTKKSIYSPLKDAPWTTEIVNTNGDIRIESDNPNCLDPVHFTANSVGWLMSIITKDVNACIDVDILALLFRILPTSANCTGGGQCFAQANLTQGVSHRSACITNGPSIGNEIFWAKALPGGGAANQNCLSYLPLPSVNIDLAVNNPLIAIVSDLNGKWCNQTTFGETYQITPSKGGFHCDVTTADINVIYAHILGSNSFSCNWQYIAADVNLNNVVTAADISCIRKYILGTQDESCPPFPVYRFDHLFHYENSGLGSIFPLVTTYSYYENGLGSSNEGDFVGVMMGDVNGSCTDAQPLKKELTSTRNLTSELSFSLGSNHTENGIIRIPIYNKSDVDLSLISLSIKDPNKLINRVIPANLTEPEQLDYNYDESFKEMKLMWTATTSNVKTNSKGPLFYLELKSNVDNMHIALGDALQNEGFNIDGNHFSIHFESKKIESDMQKLIIEPNPVNDFLILQYKNRGEDNHSIRILNLQGVEIVKLEKSNSPIYVGDLPSGIYIIQLSSNGLELQQKFVKN